MVGSSLSSRQAPSAERDGGAFEPHRPSAVWARDVSSRPRPYLWGMPDPAPAQIDAAAASRLRL